MGTALFEVEHDHPLVISGNNTLGAKTPLQSSDSLHNHPDLTVPRIDQSPSRLPSLLLDGDTKVQY